MSPAFVPLALALIPCTDPTPPPPSAAPTVNQDDVDLTELSLEELMGIEVTIASRTAASVSDTPAATYVLTGDELRRSGHQSLQEALRMVPGIYVAHWWSSGWDVTSRGFTGGPSVFSQSFNNQLLVMIDGVSVYSPLFPGVWWQLLDMDLADVERVEIVRGPGGSLWGANAVSGVLNVVTKHASETQGALVTTTVGDEQRVGTWRYGQPLGENGYLRTWFRLMEHDALVNSVGQKFDEDWFVGSVGFRADIEHEDDERLMLAGRAYTSSFGEEFFLQLDNADPPNFGFVYDDQQRNGGWLLGRWEGGTEEDQSRLQAWIQRDHQREPNLQFTIDQVDVEYSRSRAHSDNQRLTWGGGVRLARSDFESQDVQLTFSPADRSLKTFRAFVQEEIELADYDARIVLGASLEHNDLTQFEIQPSARGIWSPHEDHAFWVAVSRSVRTPSLEEVNSEQNDDPAFPPFFKTTENFEAEEVWSYELGYRTQPREDLAIDIAAFLNEYDSLQSFELGSSLDSGGFPFIHGTYGNKVSADSFGLEIAADWQPLERWRLRSAYTFYEIDFDADEDSLDFGFIDAFNGLTPRHWANVRSYYDLCDDLELDIGVYWMDDLEYFMNPAYTRIDARLGWNPSERLQVSLGVQNAQRGQHPEAGEDYLFFGSEVERNVYASLRWRP